MSLHAVMKGVVMAALVCCASFAEATWRFYWNTTTWVAYVTDETWTIQLYGEEVKDFEGTTVGKMKLREIIAGPTGGGDLDMSTLSSDIAANQPGNAEFIPRGVYCTFRDACQAYGVTSLRFSEDVYSIDAQNQSATQVTTLTNVVLGAKTYYIGGQAFANCPNLTSVTGMDGVKDIQWYAFAGSSGLRTIDPYLPTGLVAVAETAFSGCTSLSGDLHLSSPFYTYVKGQFGNPKSVDFNDAITNISLSELSSVTNVGPFPAALQQINGCFGGHAGGSVSFDFSSCTNLTEVPNYFAWGSRVYELKLPPRIRRIGMSAFSGCGLLTNVSYVAQKRFRDEMLAASGEIAEGAFAGAYMNRNFEIPWGGAETTIAANAFRGCRELRTIRFAGPPPASYPVDLFTSYGDVGGAVDYRLHILGSKRHAAAWRAFATRAATDAEKAHPDCPEKRLYGIFDSSLDGTSFHNLAWVVGEMGCWDEPQGLSVLIR